MPTGQIQIERVEPTQLGSADCAALADLANAASAVDSPHLPPDTGDNICLRLQHGWDGHPVDALVLARSQGDRVVGAAEVHFSHWDNPTVAGLDIQVSPDWQADDRLAGTLLDKALVMAREHDRTSAISDAWRDSWLAGFWARRGWPTVQQAAQRRLVLADLDRSHLARLLAGAEQASPDYDIDVLPSPTPEPMVDGLLGVHRAMNDAPLDDLEIEDDVWSVERLRMSERALAARRMRVHRLLARRREDGAIAGYTVVIVEESRPRWGWQEDTSVVRAHRGHRLGLRLKTAMLQRLADVEPQLLTIDTWNAESNTHMIAVNEQLGCVVVGRGVEVQKTAG